MKQMVDALTAATEEQQPEHSAMDWTWSAGTIMYVAAGAGADEAPRAGPALPETQGPEGSTLPDVSQLSMRNDSAFGRPAPPRGPTTEPADHGSRCPFAIPSPSEEDGCARGEATSVVD